MVSPKVYVSVLTSFDYEGKMLPENLTWEDGTVYDIDRIIDIRPSAALKAGSGGDRYTIFVNGKQTYLFFERCAEFFESRESDVVGRWFVERK